MKRKKLNRTPSLLKIKWPKVRRVKEKGKENLSFKSDNSKGIKKEMSISYLIVKSLSTS